MGPHRSPVAWFVSPDLRGGRGRHRRCHHSLLGDAALHGGSYLRPAAGWAFNLDATTGALTLNGSSSLIPGAGPLSLALSNTGEFLFTKTEGAAGGGAQECIVYSYVLDVQTGALSPLAPTDTGLMQADAYPTQPVIYLTLATTNNDYAAYAYDLVTGVLTPLTASPYDLFGGTGSDSLVVSRNGKWGLMTNYYGAQVAIGAIDPSTGVLGTPTTISTGLFPVCVTVVGTVQ